LRLHDSGDNRDVPSDDGVGLELASKLALRPDTAGKRDQPARLLVEPVNNAKSRQLVLAHPEAFRDRPLGNVVEGRYQFPPFLLPGAFRGVTDRADPGGLLHHNDVFIQVTNDDPLRGLALDEWRRLHEDFNDLAFLQSPGRVHAERAADGDAATSRKSFDLRPR